MTFCVQITNQFFTTYWICMTLYWHKSNQQTIRHFVLEHSVVSALFSLPFVLLAHNYTIAIGILIQFVFLLYVCYFSLIFIPLEFHKPLIHEEVLPEHTSGHQGAKAVNTCTATHPTGIHFLRNNAIYEHSYTYMSVNASLNKQPWNGNWKIISYSIPESSIYTLHIWLCARVQKNGWLE